MDKELEVGQYLMCEGDNGYISIGKIIRVNKKTYVVRHLDPLRLTVNVDKDTLCQHHYHHRYYWMDDCPWNVQYVPVDADTAIKKALSAVQFKDQKVYDLENTLGKIKYLIDGFQNIEPIDPVPEDDSYDYDDYWDRVEEEEMMEDYQDSYPDEEESGDEELTDDDIMHP